MESVIISYSLFEPKSLHKEMRTWDLYNNQDRYWYNIPAMICINSILYPKSKIKIHISENIKENSKFQFLQKCSEFFPNLEIVEISYEYRDTEPTMWRYKPLFDKESDIVISRDIDSLPNSDEIRSTYYFLKNKQFYLHTLRTHTNHVTPHSMILAGLCAFRPKKIDFLTPLNFESYYNNYKNNPWGVDTSSLINVFIRDKIWVKNRFLDSPINTDHHKIGKPLVICNSLDQEVYKKEIDISWINVHLLEILDKSTVWAGEPIDFRGKKLEDLFSIKLGEFEKMKGIIDSCSEEIKKFYLGA